MSGDFQAASQLFLQTPARSDKLTRQTMELMWCFSSGRFQLASTISTFSGQLSGPAFQEEDIEFVDCASL
jgi:hypothetical protein